MQIHHIGVVIPSEEIAANFIKMFGLQEDYRGYVPEYQSLCIFMKGNGSPPLEFIIPSGGKLSEYNKGRGGIHHIAYKVEDIHKTKTELEKSGAQFLEETPVKGAGNFIVNFIRPRSTGGILVELVQSTK
ncbi:VOC family protein [Moorella sp. Hama-1]|uniref:VOC family protein n=1 Tax=Moorella sp. Hama-1 TaxID=2138101 RepID=UPI000D64CE32|nr:VOC family protein [Moorella sp. Hama-1]BCV21395.1 methylmalonyl-CoA epimerase [Moorella sp. Hama-1]